VDVPICSPAHRLDAPVGPRCSNSTQSGSVVAKLSREFESHHKFLAFEDLHALPCSISAGSRQACAR
jgi:hypothetical protein